MMNINKNILSIPPYISTAWKNISTLSVSEKGSLIVTLVSGSQIKIPGLSEPQLTKIFVMHAQVIQEEKTEKKGVEFSFGMPIGIDGMTGSLTNMMEHDGAQANAPNLPKEMLEKVASLTQAMGIGEMIDQMPAPQPHCNCPFCQVSRSLHGKEALPEGIEDDSESVPDEELSFRDWSVEEIDKQLFKVTSPFDPNESYQVFLGSPVGCTCGASNCEHIRIVLNS